MIFMLLFLAEWRILISISQLRTAYEDINAPIYDRVKDSN